jgi:hypothetical protein
MPCMSGYSIIRADRIEPGRKGHAVTDESGYSVKFFDTYPDAQAYVRLMNAADKPARKRRTRRADPSTVNDCDGRNFDNLGDSPDY